MNSLLYKSILLFVFVFGAIDSAVAKIETVSINNGWNANIITSIGKDGSDYYAQSFIANMSEITKFGVVIQEINLEGEISLAIATDNGSGVPNFAAPLYQGTLKNPTTTAAWYYEEGLNIPVTPGQKYYVLLDGYNNPGATGKSGIGVSNTQPIPGEGIIWSNYGGVGNWESNAQYPLAIYVEGLREVVPVPIPTLNEWGIIFLIISLILISFYFLKRLRTA